MSNVEKRVPMNVECKLEMDEKERSLLLFIIQDYYTKDVTDIKTRDAILAKLQI